MPWGFTLHEVSFSTYGNELVGAVVEGNDRGFVDNDLIVVDYYRVGCTKVNSDFLGE